MFQFKERRRVWPDVSPKRMHRRTTSSREDARRNQPSGRQKQSRGEMARRTRCDGSEAGAAGRRPGRAAAGVARCSWERGRRSGCEDKFLGFDAESPRVRKSKDGCAHSHRLQNCRTVETARAPVIERGADAWGSGSREKRGGADSRHGVDGPRTHDARQRRRAHRATRRAQTGARTDRQRVGGRQGLGATAC